MLQAAIPPYFFSTKACDEKKVIEHTKVIEDTGMTHPLLLRKAFFPSNRSTSRQPISISRNGGVLTKGKKDTKTERLQM